MGGIFSVSPASLTITANNATKVYGAALPVLSASFSGLVNGDTAASLTTPPTLSTTATASSHVRVGGYTIIASGAIDADYTITYQPGTLLITPAQLTVTANNASNVYGAPLPSLSGELQRVRQRGHGGESDRAANLDHHSDGIGPRAGRRLRSHRRRG